MFVEMWCFYFVPFIIIKIQRSCLTLSGRDLLFASRNVSCKETVQSFIAGSRAMRSGQNVWYCSKLHMVTLPGIGLSLTFSQTLCETFLTLCGSSEHYHLVCNSHTFCKECYYWCVNWVLHWFDLLRNWDKQKCAAKGNTCLVFQISHWILNIYPVIKICTIWLRFCLLALFCFKCSKWEGEAECSWIWNLNIEHLINVP